MTQIKEYIKIAVLNIKNNRGRSVLTMLGIIIGISSVIMVISVGNGVRGQINEELDGIAGGQVSIYVDSSRKDSTVRFDINDINALAKNVDHLLGVTPIFGTWGTADGPKGSYDLRLIGGTTGLMYYDKEPIIKGRFFNQNDYDNSSPVCVISESNARMLFGTTDVVGLSFDGTIWGYTQELTIIGVRKDSASALLNLLGDGGYISASVPMSMLASKYGYYIDEITQLMLFAEKNEYSSEVAKNAMNILESRHHCGGENQILTESFSDYSSQYDSILGAITIFVSFVAAISLIVGGIGVMNIMLVSVTERTREIGIRKSLGARTKSILIQFLAEAGIITLIGGLIGIVIGVAAAFLICSLLTMKASVNIITVLLASFFSCSIGIFFGIYPAKKAARLSPIEALRHE